MASPSGVVRKEFSAFAYSRGQAAHRQWILYSEKFEKDG